MLVEGKDKLGNLKLRICFNPTTIDKVIVRKPSHFKTPEDIAHSLVDACIMSVCDFKRAIGTRSLMKLHLFLLLSTQSLEDLGIK